MRPLIFLGPTGHGILPRQMDAFERRPPASRGDLLSLRDRDPGTAVLVDGMFQQDLSVSHREIAIVLDAGWRVFGLGSMGAIRAAELSELGMMGHGKIFRMYRDDPDFRDDEVALLHAPAPLYHPLSEPLVHLCAALQDLVHIGVISDSMHEAIVCALRDSWFGDRTIARFYDLIEQASDADTLERARQRVGRLENHQLKREDLLSFLKDWPCS